VVKINTVLEIYFSRDFILCLIHIRVFQEASHIKTCKKTNKIDYSNCFPSFIQVIPSILSGVSRAGFTRLGGG
jgi:hypothetical protein